jgi:chromosome segregation ATPase
MDEIKNTAEVEEQKVVTPESTSAENTTEEAIQTATSNETTETTTAAEKPAEPKTKAEVIEVLKQIVYNGGNVERTELDHLKMLYYRFHNADVASAREKFIEEGGKAEDFMPAPDMDEENFKAQLSLIREMRNKAAEALEAEKQQNLKRKQEIIERIKALAATPEDADKGYNEVKELQAEWKELKAVPAENATELWKNYQLYTEQFYDQLRLNHEMRAYDFKKNLEIKTHLCEAAEKLADVEDPISAFHQLQKLHQEYRETGPVAKELRDEIWKRFKDASTVINKRHQDHFEAIKAKEEENLAKKTELCQQVEALEFDGLKTYAQWEEMTKQVLAIQAEWKTVGFTPRKVNAEIFERFRMACDRFFQAKTAYFKANREKLNANLTAKNALIEKAEALKDSTDWGATTNKFVELQKEWKAIGPVAHKVSDAIWKRFNDACNYFFEQKNAANAGQRKEEEANLELKKGVIAELEKLVENASDDLLKSVRELQARWNEIGHVPYSKKEKMYRRYRELCDKIYDILHETAGRRRMDNFRKNVADKGGSELTRERGRLQNALENKKQEIQNYETNLTFFRSSSKKGNSLVADIEKKVERLKEDLNEIVEKIKAVNEQIKAEKEAK